MKHVHKVLKSETFLWARGFGSACYTQDAWPSMWGWTQNPSLRDIRKMSGCFLGPGSWPQSTHRPHKHTNSFTCGHLCITRAQVLYIEQWVELSVNCTCTDSETVRQRMGQTHKPSLHRHVHSSLCTILDYYILYRIKRMTEDSICKEELCSSSTFQPAGVCFNLPDTKLQGTSLAGH